jgi:hypothetical protein
MFSEISARSAPKEQAPDTNLFELGFLVVPASLLFPVLLIWGQLVYRNAKVRREIAKRVWERTLDDSPDAKSLVVDHETKEGATTPTKPMSPVARDRIGKHTTTRQLLLYFSLTGMACALIVAGLLLYHGTKWKPKVTRENFERLEVGMEELTVFKLLGDPSRRDESVIRRVDPRWRLRYTVRPNEFLQRCFWEDGDNLIWADLYQGLIQDYGAVLDGEQLGKYPLAPSDNRP